MVRGYDHNKDPMIGSKIDSFTVIRRSFDKYIQNRNNNCYYLCRCGCGHEYLYTKASIKRGKILPCRGCRPRSRLVPCDVCGKLTKKNNSDLKARKHLFCSKKCYSFGIKIEKTCLTCGCVFLVTPGGNNRKYCSEKCYGIHLSKLPSEKSPRWNGASYVHRRRSSPPYKKWKKAVLERDGKNCQVCGSLTAPHVHHIKSFSSIYNDEDHLVYDIDNGIVLCEICHRLFHKTHGMVKNDTNQLVKFISSMWSHLPQPS